MKSLEVLAVGCLRAYQWTLRPVLPMACRFWPSCSDYAIEAVRRHGAARGGMLAAWRLLRCHPWGGSGLDPVPERFRLLAEPRRQDVQACGQPNHDHI